MPKTVQIGDEERQSLSDPEKIASAIMQSKEKHRISTADSLIIPDGRLKKWEADLNEPLRRALGGRNGIGAEETDAVTNTATKLITAAARSTSYVAEEAGRIEFREGHGKGWTEVSGPGNQDPGSKPIPVREVTDEHRQITRDGIIKGLTKSIENAGRIPGHTRAKQAYLEALAGSIEKDGLVVEIDKDSRKVMAKPKREKELNERHNVAVGAVLQ